MRALVLVLFLGACASVQPGPQATVDEFLAALDRGDASIAGLFTEDATVFFPINNQPLRANGRAEIAAAFASLFGPNYRGGLPKPDAVQVQSFGETAVVTFQNVNPNVTSRRTFVLRREAGRWRIVHLHGSNIRKD
ncbi:MAG TPA: nuclear transport factor 2 family protein [Thermoanaerobaculia bacterium]|nr:nuclear transport factor 2 family protein [Thermoanaerobaculia bacterium]